MIYEVKIGQSALKSLGKLPKRDRNKIIERIDGLGQVPRPHDVKKIAGSKKPILYRIRSGKYRIIYTIQDSELLIAVIEIAHRKDVYQSM